MLASLRHVAFAGEVFPTPFLRRLRELVPAAALHNWYGPTETNVCTAHTIRARDVASDEPVPIGRPCDEYRCRVVDDAGAPATDGELLVGGPGVSAGYWGDPERTAESFLAEADGTRWYRTGDLVRTGPEGEYRFRGRRDHQVKVRGYRVELGEVESAIHADDRVGEACVVAVADDRRGHDLVAFVCPRGRPVVAAGGREADRGLATAPIHGAGDRARGGRTRSRPPRRARSTGPRWRPGRVVDLSPTVADAPWLTDDLLEFRSNVVTFANGELAQTPADRIARDRDAEFWRAGWDACGRFGIQGLPVPGELGGQGQDALTTAIALEALGSACEDGGLLFSINAHLWSAVTPVWKHGTPEQQRRWLPGLCDGSLIGIHAVTEPGAGSDAFGMTTRAEPDGDGWRITGRKTFISNAPVADLLIVFARTTPGTGPTGITAFLLERGAAGMEVPGHLDKMGLRTSPMGEIVLEGVAVDTGDVLGTVGRGARVFQTSMDWERGLIMSAQVGAMQRVTERSVRYATQRRQFGQADREVRERGRTSSPTWRRGCTPRGPCCTAPRTSWTPAGIPPPAAHRRRCSSRRRRSPRTWTRVQIHGGYGYMTEFEVERALRDALGGTIYSGTSEIQRRLIAKRLGL